MFLYNFLIDFEHIKLIFIELKSILMTTARSHTWRVFSCISVSRPKNKFEEERKRKEK